MNQKLTEILEALLANIKVLNDEVERLSRSGQFSHNAQSLQLIECIRGTCTTSLQNIRTVEQMINRGRV